jgi:hypothetical protein
VGVGRCRPIRPGLFIVELGEPRDRTHRAVRSSASGWSASPASGSTASARRPAPPDQAASPSGCPISGCCTSGPRTARSAARWPRWRRPVLGDAVRRARGALAQDAAPAPTTADLVGEHDGHRGIRGRRLCGVRRGAHREGAAERTEGEVVLPWANLRRPTGRAAGDRPDRRPAGRAGEAAPPTTSPTRIVTLPDAEADGARDEARRGRRPAPGPWHRPDRVGRGLAAQGSPAGRRGARSRSRLRGWPDSRPSWLRLRGQRPEVVQRIATAPRARRSEGERRVPRRSGGAGLPRGPDLGARGQAAVPSSWSRPSVGPRGARLARAGRFGWRRDGPSRWSGQPRPTAGPAGSRARRRWAAR